MQYSPQKCILQFKYGINSFNVKLVSILKFSIYLNFSV